MANPIEEIEARVEAWYDDERNQIPESVEDALLTERDALSSQLERLTAENGRLTAQLDGCHNSRNFSDADLERLKAERLTAEEVNQITLYIPNGLQSWGITPSARQYWQALNEKLRLQSGETTDV